MTPILQNSPRLAERLFVIAAVMLLSEALTPLLSDPDLRAPTGPRENLLIQAILAGVYLVTYLLILPRYRVLVWLCWQNKALLLILGLALLSIFWSADPDLTWRRLIGLLGATGFGFYLAIRFRPDELFRLLLWTLGIMAALSLVFVVALPDVGVHHTPHLLGAWRGVFGHRNRAGRVFTFGVLLFVLMASKHQRHRWLAWPGLGMCGLLVAMSGSRGSWLLTGSVLVLFAFLQVQRKAHHSIAIPAVMLGILALSGGIIWVVADFETAMAMIGRDVTLTGRTKIWTFVITSTDRPWFGYGYSGFWRSDAAANLLHRTTLTKFSGGHAHNGYLQLWLQLGIAGIAAFLATVFVCLRRLISRLTYSPALGPWVPALVGFNLIGTIPYPIMGHNDIFWALYVAVLFYLTEIPVASETIKNLYHTSP